MTSPVASLLDRLSDVRRYGEAWRATCPARAHSSKATLVISEGHDGRALVVCHAGCDPSDVTAALGLRMADLFASRVTAATPDEKRAAADRMRAANWAAALGVLGREATIVLIAAECIANGETLSTVDIERLRAAIRRIQRAREMLQ